MIRSIGKYRALRDLTGPRKLGGSFRAGFLQIGILPAGSEQE